MSPKKTATLNLRIDPILKEAAREAALRDQRSVANMIEVLIRRHCEAAGIPIPDQQSLFAEDEEDGREDTQSPRRRRSR
jgi:hypothetical protein